MSILPEAEVRMPERETNVLGGISRVVVRKILDSDDLGP